MIECCICESKKHSSNYRSVDGYQIVKCRTCELVYIEDKTDPLNFMDDAKKELTSENKKVEYWSFPDMYKKYTFVFEEYFRKRIDRCLTYNAQISSLFDIGSGYGFWMDFCRQRGLSVKGIDISEEAVEYGRQVLSLDITNHSLRDYTFTDQYDLYNLCDVLEHIENPNEELSMLHCVMKPTSLLYIQVPDVLGVRIPYRHNLGLPHHIWQFNYRTLKRLLTKNGFRVLNRWHGVQGVIGCYEKNEVNIFKRMQWQMAEKLNLGNRLMVICQKV